MGLIDSIDNGATEIPGTTNNSTRIFLAGPIRGFWNPQMESRDLRLEYYAKYRDKVWEELTSNYLVYAPHRAMRGPWDDSFQSINDFAISRCHAFVYLMPALSWGMTHEGTDAELAMAQELNLTIWGLKVGDYGAIVDLGVYLRRFHHERIERLKAVHTGEIGFNPS